MLEVESLLRVVNNFSKRRIDYDEYKQALTDCKYVAEKQATYVSGRIKDLKKTLKKNNEELKLFINQANDLTELKDESLMTMLESFNDTISNNLHSGIKNIEESIDKKKKNLSTFTVTLFGRTKAGKSTIREALTEGNGESIGKGSQRTTRDIREYYWNNLRIIDTPGISAYEGEEDVEIAESVIDESDLIMFLVTNDSIQETEFEKLVQLRSQNKPIIILLNVKEDIDDELFREIFLENYKDTISLNGQAGNVERIKEYSKKYLGRNNFKIIPIHALSAFRSTKEEDKDLKRKLYNASNLNKVKIMLRELVVNQGKQKRVLSFRDDYIYYLRSLESVYWNNFKQIKPRVHYIRGKHKAIKSWFEDFKTNGLNTIDGEVSQIFTQLSSEVDAFVDSYAGNKNAERKWNEKVESYKLHERINEIYQSLSNEAKRNLNEFSRQITFEVNNLNFDSMAEDVGELKRGVMGKVARWGGAALSVTWLFTVSNFWNPAGWVSGVIGIGGALMGVISIFSGNDSKKFDKRKSEIKTDIKRSVNKMSNDTKKQLRSAFKKNIINPLYEQINIEWDKNVEMLFAYLNLIKESAIRIRKEEQQENVNLFKLLYEQTYLSKFNNNSMLKVAREQGVMTKIMTHEDKNLKQNNSRRLLENIIGEKLVYIEFINEPSELFRRSLFPAKTEDIELEINLPQVIIRASKGKISGIIGKKGRNIKLTNRLFDDISITVKEMV